MPCGDRPTRMMCLIACVAASRTTTCRSHREVTQSSLASKCLDDFLGSFQTPEGKAAWAAISADEPNLADHKRCYTYVGEEIQLLPERR